MNKLTHAASPWRSLRRHRRRSDASFQRQREEIRRARSWSLLAERALGKFLSAAMLSLQFVPVLLWVMFNLVMKATLIVGSVAAIPFLLFLALVAFSLGIEAVGTALNIIL